MTVFVIAKCLLILKTLQLWLTAVEKVFLKSQATPTENGLIIKAVVVRATVSSLRIHQ